VLAPGSLTTHGTKGLWPSRLAPWGVEAIFLRTQTQRHVSALPHASTGSDWQRSPSWRPKCGSWGSQTRPIRPPGGGCRRCQPGIVDLGGPQELGRQIPVLHLGDGSSEYAPRADLRWTNAWPASTPWLRPDNRDRRRSRHGRRPGEQGRGHRFDAGWATTRVSPSTA